MGTNRGEDLVVCTDGGEDWVVGTDGVENLVVGTEGGEVWVLGKAEKEKWVEGEDKGEDWVVGVVFMLEETIGGAHLVGGVEDNWILSVDVEGGGALVMSSISELMGRESFEGNEEIFSICVSDLVEEAFVVGNFGG